MLNSKYSCMPCKYSWNLERAAQTVKNLPAMQETWLERSPEGGHGNPLQYSCLELSPWTEEPGGLQSMGL